MNFNLRTNLWRHTLITEYTFLMFLFLYIFLFKYACFLELEYLLPKRCYKINECVFKNLKSNICIQEKLYFFKTSIIISFKRTTIYTFLIIHNSLN